MDFLADRYFSNATCSPDLGLHDIISLIAECSIAVCVQYAYSMQLCVGFYSYDKVEVTW